MVFQTYISIFAKTLLNQQVMKKRFLFLCCLCLSVVWVGCKKNDSDIDVDGNEVQKTVRNFIEVQKAAWDLISAEGRERVTHSWKGAKVEMVAFDFFYTSDESLLRVYAKYACCYQVTFNTTDEALLGPIWIYLADPTLEYLGRYESKVMTDFQF